MPVPGQKAEKGGVARMRGSQVHDNGESNGARRQQVHEELRRFLGVTRDVPDEYGRMMRELPERGRREIEDLFRDYPAAGEMRIRVLRIVHAVYAERARGTTAADAEDM